MLLGYYSNHIIKRLKQLVIPATNLSELLDTEIKEQRSKLGKEHVC